MLIDAFHVISPAPKSEPSFFIWSLLLTMKSMLELLLFGEIGKSTLTSLPQPIALQSVIKDLICMMQGFSTVHTYRFN